MLVFENGFTRLQKQSKHAVLIWYKENHNNAAGKGKRKQNVKECFESFLRKQNKITNHAPCTSDDCILIFLLSVFIQE